MNYKTILVSLNEIGRLPQLLAAAAALARPFAAHVVGLYVVPAVQVYPALGFDPGPVIVDGNHNYLKELAPKIRANFEAAMQRGSISFSFHEIDAASPFIANDVIACGRCADLVIITATSPDEVTAVEDDFVKKVVMATGRPVIVLPAKGESKLEVTEVVLGWDGGREAARATFDAMPILQTAKNVQVVLVDPQKDAGLPGSVVGADIAESLARHKVKVEVKGYPTDGMDPGQALLRCADDTGAGLIVMGAYGHSRFTEFVFGSSTRFMLMHMNRPVLMSH